MAERLRILDVDGALPRRQCGDLKRVGRRRPRRWSRTGSARQRVWRAVVRVARLENNRGGLPDLNRHRKPRLRSSAGNAPRNRGKVDGRRLSDSAARSRTRTAPGREQERQHTDAHRLYLHVSYSTALKAQPLSEPILGIFERL